MTNSAAEALGTAEILANILSFVENDVGTNGGDRYVLSRDWKRYRSVNSLWKRETDRLIGICLSRSYWPWKSAYEWPYASETLPGDAKAAKRAVKHLRLRVPLVVALMPHPNAHPPPAGNFADQCRKLFEDFPSLRSVSVDFAQTVTNFAPHIATLTFPPHRPYDYMFSLGSSTDLIYDRDKSQFGLLADVHLTGLGRSGFIPSHPVWSPEIPHIEWSPQSRPYRDVMEMPDRENGIVRTLEIMNFPVSESGLPLLYKLGYDPAGISSSARTVRAPLRTVTALDLHQPQWHRLRVLETSDDRSQKDDAALRTLADLATRAPELETVALYGVTCRSQQWHPLVIFLRTLGEKLSATSSVSRIENLVVMADLGWVKTDAVSQELRDQAYRDIFGRFPHLWLVRFNWPNAPEESVDPGDRFDYGTSRMMEIRELLKAASGDLCAFELNSISRRWWLLTRQDKMKER